MFYNQSNMPGWVPASIFTHAAQESFAQNVIHAYAGGSKQPFELFIVHEHTHTENVVVWRQNENKDAPRLFARIWIFRSGCLISHFQGPLRRDSREYKNFILLRHGKYTSGVFCCACSSLDQALHNFYLNQAISLVVLFICQFK